MSNRDDSRNRSEHEAQARAIASALGDGWIVRDDSRTPAEWHSWQLQRVADGLTFDLGWPEPYGRDINKPRLEISGSWPTDVDNMKRIIRTPYGQKDPTTSISVDFHKPAATIAKDISKRLIPSFAPLYAEAVRQCQNYADHQATEARTLAALVATGHGAHISPNARGTVYLGQASYAYTLSASGSEVRFEAFSCPLEVALRILPLLHKEAPRSIDPEPEPCSLCGVALSDSQARLSALRADDAEPACADCLTLQLTIARQAEGHDYISQITIDRLNSEQAARRATAHGIHEAADPHCTCNDCLASHADKLKLAEVDRTWADVVKALDGPLS